MTQQATPMRDRDPGETGSTYEVHYLTPDYPDRCFPGRCRHDPQFVMHADLRIVRVRGRNQIEVDHAVCLACGAPRPCTVGGNVIVDLTMIAGSQGLRCYKFGVRALHLRTRWVSIAARLFGKDGWTGRHERVARMIDPNLTMRLEVTDAGSRIGRMSFDAGYLRDHGADWQGGRLHG